MVTLTGKYFSIFLFSTLKFAGGPIMGTTFGFHWPLTAFITILGMMTSVTIFSLIGKPAKEWINKRFFSETRLFSANNRRTANIWRKYGLKGVAFLTPILLTPVGGTLVAISFGEPKGEIFIYMLYSAVLGGNYSVGSHSPFWAASPSGVNLSE
jgi:glycerol-3-phosphate acyltransferase PlsY